MGENPSSALVTAEMGKLSKRLRAGKSKRPVENYFIVFLFAGHGILKDGMQAMLYNEYDEASAFYKVLTAEAKLRLWSEIYPNAYIVGIFACCRQLYDHTTMTGCISKERAISIQEEGLESIAAFPQHLGEFKKHLQDFQLTELSSFQAHLATYRKEQAKLDQKLEGSGNLTDQVPSQFLSLSSSVRQRRETVRQQTR